MLYFQGKSRKDFRVYHIESGSFEKCTGDPSQVIHCHRPIGVYCLFCEVTTCAQPQAGPRKRSEKVTVLRSVILQFTPPL